MAKTDIDKRVTQALRSLLAPREDSIRTLAEALDNITTIDDKISTLLHDRTKALQSATSAVDDAKTAGWKPRELSEAGLTVPRAITVPALTTPAKKVAASNESGNDQTHA